MYLFVENQPLESTADHIITYTNNVTGHGEDFGHICCQPVTDKHRNINESNTLYVLLLFKNKTGVINNVIREKLGMKHKQKQVYLPISNYVRMTSLTKM